MKLHLMSALALALAAPGLAQDIPMQPYPVDHEARTDSEADARFLHDGPAGSHGFIQVRDGHLYRADGKRFRCWGVNLTGWTVGGEEIPSHKDAETYAAALARLGVNCVRMHFLDRPDTELTLAAMQALIDDRDRLDHCRASATAEARNYTFERYREKIAQLLDRELPN